MEKIIKIKSEQFSSNIQKFENKANDIADCLEKISTQMMNIDGTNNTWKSKNAELIYDDYKNLEKQFEKINVELCSYVVFLKDTLSEYEKLESQTDKKIDDNSSNLDINE